jgi:hypothetical protein
MRPDAPHRADDADADADAAAAAAATTTSTTTNSTSRPEAAGGGSSTGMNGSLFPDAISRNPRHESRFPSIEPRLLALPPPLRRRDAPNVVKICIALGRDCEIGTLQWAARV